MARAPIPTYEPEYVREISTAAYRARFSADDVERILADPKRGEAFFTRNSGSYDGLTRAYLDAINAAGLRPRAIRETEEATRG